MTRLVVSKHTNCNTSVTVTFGAASAFPVCGWSVGLSGFSSFSFIAWKMPDSSQEAISFTLKLILCSYFCAIIRTICFQVLDAGKIHAYDEPYTLLQDPTNIFYKMVQQTGKQEAAALLEAAKKVSLFSLSVKNLSQSLFVNWHL